MWVVGKKASAAPPLPFPGGHLPSALIDNEGHALNQSHWPCREADEPRVRPATQVIPAGD